MSGRAERRLFALVAAAAGGLGCAALRSSGGDLSAGDPAQVAAALGISKSPVRRPANSTGKPLAIAVTGGPGGARLVAFDLDARRVLWSEAAEVTARPLVGAHVVLVTQKGDELVARDVASGAVRWREKPVPGGRRMGCAVDGDDVYCVTQLSASGGALRSELVALDGASGMPRWRLELPPTVGGPAARGGLVAVPVRSQYVTLVDGRSGKQLAQILSRDEAATFVIGRPEGLFFGSKGVFLAEEATASGSRKAPGYIRAALPAFARDLYHRDMYDARLMDYSALDRNRVLWRASVDGAKVEFQDGMAFVHNYRFILALDAKSGAMRWAYGHPRIDAVSSEHTGRSIVFIAADGEIGALDAATGRRTFSARLPNAAVRGATFDAEGFAGPESGEAPALAAALGSIIWDPDRRFSEVKTFAVDQLAKLPGRDVTGQLLKLVQKEGLPPALHQKAADVLVARKDRSAVDLLIQAIEIHPDYASDAKPPGIELLAEAVAAMGAKEAAPALREHLRLPDTGLLAVAKIAETLVALDDRDAVPVLRDFLLEYRADPSFAGDPAALIAVADALVKLGGVAERQILLYVAEEPKTLEALRVHVRRVLAVVPASGAAPPAGRAAE